MQAEAEGFVYRYLPVVVSGLSFLVAMLFLVLHRKHLHTDPSPQGNKAAQQVAGKQSFRAWGDCQECSSRGKRQADPPRQNLLYFTCGMTDGDTRAAGGRVRSWLLDSSASDCVSVTTASTAARPPLRIAGEESGSDARSPRYRSPAGASCVLPGCMDLGHPSRSTSICTLTTNTTTLRPGDEERSLDTAVDLLPGWLTSQGVGLKYARDPRPIPHTQHTAQQALRSPSSGHPRQPHIMTPRHYRPVPTQAAAARGRVSSSHSDGYSTDHTVLEWSKLPVTPLAANVWSIQDTTDTDCCCCRRCYLSAAESEAASMDPAPHPARGKGCQACLGSAGDVVYGIPREVLRLPDKGPTTAGVSSPPELQMPCSSCRLYQQRRPDHGRHSSVFTIPSRRDGCCGSDTCGYYVNASCLACSSDGSAHEVLRKNKQQSHRRRRRHQTSRASIRNGHLLSVGSSTFSSMETIETGSVSGTDTGKRQGSKERQLHHHLHTPSRLQVRAVVQLSDENIPGKERTKSSLSLTSDPPEKFNSSLASEPVYENVSALIEERPCNNNTTVPKTTSVSTGDSTPNTSKKTSTTRQEKVNSDLRFPIQCLFNQKPHGNQQSDLKIQDASTEEKMLQKQDRVARQRNNRRPSVSLLHWEQGRARRSRSSGGGYPRQWNGVGVVRETGCVWSESEDSALPTETFSSSVEDQDVFLATDPDSEHNEELII